MPPVLERQSARALTVLLIAVAAAACGKPSSQDSRSTPAARSAVPARAESAAPIAVQEDTSAGEPLPLEFQAARGLILGKWTGDLDGMIERRLVRVLTSYSKTFYFVDKGTERGLVYDAFRMFENDLNKSLKNKNVKVHVVIVPVAHDELIPALLDGRGDVVATGTLVNEFRRQQVDFTDPTRTGVSVIPVTGPGAPPVARVEDLAGREVYIRPSMVASQNVERFNAELARKGLPPAKIRPAPEVLADEDILEMVNAGLAPTTLAFDYMADFWKQTFPNLVLNTTAAVKTGGEVAWMVRKGSPRLKEALNGFLARNPQGSAGRNMLFQKYLKNVKYARDATSQAERAKFEQTVSLFRKYGDKYSLDYLLVMAQAYQESQLDQDAKSAVGAVGVMQLMPTTGQEMKVGDIRRLEPNVHAGVKYMRFMIDKYYANAPMDRVDKGLFTFASYNAGPGRIAQLRQRAANRGLDPNKWFNNVEVVAAETIGRETVQYVANIYKYYLAYQMLSQYGQRREAAKMAARK